MSGYDLPWIGDVALHVIAQDPRARMIVDQRLRILWSNESAKRQLTLLDAVSIEGETLSLKKTDQQSKLVAALKQVKDEPFTLWLLSNQALKSLVVLIYPKQVGEVTVYVLEFFTEPPISHSTYIDVSVGFNLTGSENAVLCGLQNGYSPQELARLRNVGIETIRAQIRSIYVKMGVRNREQLFHRLMAFKR